jgi:Holliday junction resolvasome RuvABC endonuclease subunit
MARCQFRKELTIIKILSIDQAKAGAWALFDYNSKTLLEHGHWDYSKAPSYQVAINKIKNLIQTLITEKEPIAVFLEDINYRQNIESFKKLAWLQGTLICFLEENEYLYDLIQPSQWQNYCKARGRTDKEIKAKITEVDTTGKKNSKVLSLQFVKDKYNVDTTNDNISDSICLGHYAVNNITIEESGD